MVQKVKKIARSAWEFAVSALETFAQSLVTNLMVLAGMSLAGWLAAHLLH